MSNIYKYKLKVGFNELEIPYEKILNVISQQATPTLYAIVNSSKPNKKLQVIVAGTGWDLEDNVLEGIYLNTITDGFYVWHVFYKEE